MGFYNIILEGQQAEEYKARKAKEAEDEIKNRERDYRRSSTSFARQMGDTDTEHRYGLGKSGNRYDSGKSTNFHNSGKSRETHSVRYDDEKRSYVHDGDDRVDIVDKDDVQVDASKDDIKRQKYATQAAKRAVKPGLFPDNETKRQLDLARDAVNRNMRRHPEKWNKSHHEQGIFESVEFLND